MAKIKTSGGMQALSMANLYKRSPFAVRNNVERVLQAPVRAVTQSLQT